jgi:hypothetical protein
LALRALNLSPDAFGAIANRQYLRVMLGEDSPANQYSFFAIDAIIQHKITYQRIKVNV